MIKKTIKLSVLCFLVFMLPSNIKALCDNSKISELKDLASNINISYGYEIVDNKASFNITFDNVFEGLLLQDENGTRYPYSIYNIIGLTFYNMKQGTSYKFDVYADGGECDNTYLTTLYATTPKYNPYYNLKICDDAREYELCQRWATYNLTYTEFVDNVKNYINKKNQVNETEEDDKIGILSFILNFIVDYYLYIIGLIVLIIIAVKYIRYKKDTFGF